MSTDANTAASSAAPDAPAPLADLAALSDAQRADWRKTGQLPDATPSDAATDSSPVPPVEQAASTDASSSPASESGTPSKDKGKGVEARTKELDTEIAQLREKLRIRATLREELDAIRPQQDAKPADSSPAPAVPKFPEFAQWADLTGNPNATYEEYIDARTDFRFQQQQQASQRQAQEASQRTEVHERVHTFKTRCDEAVKADPDFWTKVHPALGELRPIAALAPGEALTGGTVLAEEILRSPVSPQLLLHFSAHPDEFAALVQQPDFNAIVRAIGKLEAKLDAPVPPTVPPPKTVTEAPPPPPTLSSRAQAPIDEEQAALAAGDFARYRAVVNAKAVSAHR